MLELCDAVECPSRPVLPDFLTRLSVDAGAECMNDNGLTSFLSE